MPEAGRRHLSELLADNLLYWLSTKIRARAGNRGDFQQVVIPTGDLIGTRVFATGRFELTQFDAIKALIASAQSIMGVSVNPRGVFIDVGANIGLYTIAFSPVFSRTIAFEANPTTFKILEANVELNRRDNVQCICLAISNEARNGTLFVPNDGNLGWASLDECAQRVKIPVKLQTLDNLSSSLNLDKAPVALMKIDIEGHEAAALLGSRDLLIRWRPMVLFEALDAQAGIQCVEILKSCGYTRFYRFRRSLGWQDGGIKGCLAALVRGLPIRYEVIDSEADYCSPLVCAIRGR